MDLLPAIVSFVFTLFLVAAMIYKTMTGRYLAARIRRYLAGDK